MADDDTSKAPAFFEQPKIKQDENSSDVVFECIVSSYPKPEVFWYFKDKLLKKRKRKIPEIKQLAITRFYVALRIKDPIDKDTGPYKVLVKNRKGEATATINANFKEEEEEVEDQKAPTFTKKPAIRQEDDGNRLLFECIIDANPPPTIAWFRDEKPVTVTDRIKIRSERKGNAFHCALVIDDVDEDDGGKYKVTAKNNLGEGSATINLNFDTEEEEEEEGKPTFLGKPLIKQSPDFNSIIFECNLTADPKPTLHWFHNGKPITEGGRYKSVLKASKTGFLGTLEIAQVGDADGGEYKVVAKNSVGEGSAAINLNFEGDASKKIPGGKAPRFPKKPAIKQLGESLCLEVVLEAHPMPKITWFLGTKEVKEGPRHKIIKKETAKDTYLISLEISDPSPEDGGTYRCNAVNELGESNANIALNLQGDEGPTFTQKPKIIPKEGGKLILMECHVKSKSALKVTWYQGNKMVKESIRIKSSIVELRGNEYKVALEIRDPTGNDGGVYKCNIKNDEGEINANLNLNIEGERIEGDPPTFVEKPKIISQEDGKRIIMEFKVKANPKPTIIWYLDNVVIKETARIAQIVKQEKEVYHIKLELKNPELTDAGLYKCNVKNPAGEINANLTLNIELAPVIREKPKVVRREKEKKIVIECHVNSNAKPECIWYKENSMVKQDTRHQIQIKQIQKGEYAVFLEIDKPSITDKGLYKLQAKNEKGIIASDPIKVTLEDETKEEEEKKKKDEEEKKKKDEEEKKKKDLKKIQEKKEEVKEKKEEQKVEQKKLLEKKEEQKVEQKKVLEKKEEQKIEQKKVLEKKEEQKETTKKTLETKETAKKDEKVELTKKATEKKEEQVEAAKKLEKKEEVKKTTKTTTEAKVDQKEEVLAKTELEKKQLAKKTEIEQKEALQKKTLTKKEEERKDSLKTEAERKGSVKGQEEETKAPFKRGLKKPPPKEEEKPVELGKVVLKKRTGVPPKFLTLLESKVVDVGKSVEFKCDIESKERVTVIWYKNRLPIDEPRHYRITFEGKTASLFIQRAIPDFSGVYTCEATNQFGKEEISTTLLVKEPGMKMPEIKELEQRMAAQLEPMPIFEDEEPEKKTAEKKKVVKKKKKTTTGKAGAEEEVEEEEETEVSQTTTEEKDQKGKAALKPITIVKEATPEPATRKDSIEPSGTGSRRGSSSNLLPTPQTSQRRGSITLIADEKGLLTDDKGNIKKLRPGEVLEIRQKRKTSTDMRRASVSEIEERIDKPSTPLRKIPEDEECPPTFVDYQENVTATEGATAYLCFQVEGNPEPEFRYYKGESEIFEGGRYKVVTDGETNTVYFCIRKAKDSDEGRYKFVAYNKHGEDSISMSLFVSDESGMDFRAMLKRRQYAKWGKGDQDPDWGSLKPGEQERRPSFTELKKADFFTKNLENQHVKEGRDKKVRFEAVFSRSNVKAKWMKNKQEIYMGKRYHISCQGDLHVLEINFPTLDDEARYSVHCGDANSSAYLEVDPPEPVYKIIKKLPAKMHQYTTKEATLECTCNSSKAPVKWYKGDQQIESSDKYVLGSDTFGHKTLKIQNCRLEDTGEYTCKITEEEKTTTSLTITEQQFQFMRPLKSMRVMEKEKVVLECEVDEYDAIVRWFKGDKELVKTKDKKFDLTQEGRKRRLIIKSAKLVDEGEYTCKTNADTTTAELIVEPSNKFVKRLKDQSVVERDQIVLEVELMDKKAPAEWFKDGQPIKPSNNITIKSLGEGKHQLIINNCQIDDAGEYECRSKELSTSGRLAVGEGEKPPKISRDKTEFAGDANKMLTAEIPFTIPGTKVSDIAAKLLRNGKPLTAKDVEVSVRNDKVVIIFRKPPRESSGDYELCMSNATGEDRMKVNFNFMDIPLPPQGPLDVTDIFRDRCKLAWKPPTDNGGTPITHYLVEMQDMGARGGWIEIGTTETTNYDVTGLVNKKEYKFRVRAVNKKGASDPLVSAKPIIAKDPYDEPSKPGNLEVTDWDVDLVELKWTPPAKDGGSPITGYIIEYKDKFTKDWTKGSELPPTATKGKVEGLKEGVQYEFRVKAVNKAGPGEASDPTKPIIVKARFVKPYIIGDDLKNVVVKKGQVIKYDINIGGEPPPDIKWDINGVELTGSKKITIDKSAKNTTITIKEAERADSGKITLTLTNSVGKCTGEADVVVLDKPSRPSNIRIEEVQAQKAVVKWDPPKDTGGSEIEGYVIEKCDAETGRWVPAGETGPQERKFTVEPLTPKKKYNFRVKAKNKEGESDPLQSEKPVVAKNPYDEPGKPGRPEIVDYDNTKVDLKWSPPSSDGGSPITNYVVEMKDKLSNDWKEVLKVDGTKCEGKVTNLVENASVQFRIKAINKAGPSEPSTETPLHIVKHRNLKPYIDRTNLTNIVLKVGRSHKYEVDIRGEPPPKVVWTFGEDIKLSNDDFIKIDNRDYHSDIYFNKLTRKHSGKYTITASNASGKDTVTVEVTVLGTPTRPEGPLDVSGVHKEGCKLKWKKPKDDGGLPIKQYEIEKLDKETGRWTRCGKTDQPEFEVTGLTPGKEYLFRVVATNDEGESEPLETLEPIVAKNPYDEPDKPGTPQIVDYDNIKVDLKWDKPKSDGGAPITKYIIEKKLKSSQDWEKALEVSGDKLQTDVADLKERQEYQFRVIAVNKAGQSQPSDPTKLHLVKHRRLKPYIDRSNLDTITVKKGKTIKLEVNVRGEPPPVITWKLKDKIVQTKDNVEVYSEENYKTRITINEAMRKDTGLYVIIAENEVGRDEAQVEFVVLGAPSRPGGPLKVEDVTAKGCKLKWSKPEDDGGKPISGYQVEKLDTSTGNWVPVGRTDEPEMDVPGLTPGKEYQFRVKAINPEGESEPLVTDRPTVAKNPYDEPGPPGMPDITDWDENHVDLKWTPPKSDGGAPITGYVIEKKERYGPGWEPCLTTSSPKPEAKVPNLTYGNNYQFRVRAVNKAGQGEPSEPTKSHTAKPRYLAPKIVRDNLQQIVVRAGQSVKLDVEVIGEPPPNCTWSFGGKALDASESIKIENEEYMTHLSIKNGVRKQSGKYKITAVNSSGKDEEEVEIIFLDKPSKPEGPLEVSDVHAEGCKLAWNKPKDDGGTPITGYAVERMDPTTGRWIPAGRVDKDKLEMPVTGLDPGKKYQFRVKALNDEGESEPLETERATLAKNPYDEPGPPGLPEIKDYDADFVQLKWEPPLRDGGAPITGYIIEKKDKYSPEWVPVKEIEGNVPQAKITGLNEGDKYEFRVRAVNKAGPGEPSQSTTPHLSKPKNLKPRIDRTNLKNIIIKVGQMVNFDVDIIGEPPPKVQWRFGLKHIDDGDVYNINNVDYNSKFCLPKATRKDTGMYYITATNASGSDEAEVEITVLGKPMRPNGPLEVSDVTKEGCKLKWKPPDDDGGSPIEYYEIEKMDTETGMWVPAGKAMEPKFDVKNLMPGKNYKFRVRAVNKEGDSEELQTEKSTLAKNPYDEPSKPGRPEATDWDSDHVDLKWKAPESDGGAPITGYIIEKKKKGTYKWHKAKETNTPATSATVPDLEDREEYEFRVIAVNKAGPSEPSEASKSVIAKPRSLKPFIDRTNLNNIVIKAGNVVKFDADVRGEPPPKITWLFKGQPITSGEKTKIDNEDYHTLFILTKTQRSDTGTYTVTAVNDAGKDQVDVEITVLSKPSKPKGPLEVSDVNAEGCKLKWDKPEDDGGQPVKEYVVEKMDTETGRWIPVTTTKEPQADIGGLIPGKEYKFRVKAVNPEGESEPLETSTGTVAKNPFDEPGKPGKPSGHDWGKHYADLIWTAPKSDGGAPITSYIIEKKDKYSTKWQKAVETIGDKCEARVSDLIEGMEYQFRVKAVNKAGPSEPSDPSTPLIAKPRFLAPKISNLKDMTVRAGQTVRFDAKVIGEPPPKKTWTLGKDVLKTAGRMTLENEDYRSKLVINSVERRDCGEYKLCVENNSGKDEETVILHVLDKPGKPGGPLDISNITAEGCKIKWKEPEDDGGTPIEHYAVEKMDLATGRWVPAGRCSKPELDLNNLIPGQEYKFRVTAINAEGESTPLEGEKAIVAKNPYDPPGKPGLPEATDWDKEWIDLKWTKPLKDGGAPITGYLIEKKEKDSTIWSKALQIDKPVTEGRVENLIPGEHYQYRVKAINAAGPGEPSDATKSIEAKPRKMAPRIDRRTLKPITVRAGQPFSLDVKIAGEPPPTVTWMLKNEPIPDRYEFQIKNVPYNSKIECSKAERKDSGVYKIFAKNPHGQDMADVEITVLSKASKPEGPLDVSDVRKDGCKLKWGKPSDDGGFPLEGYLVEKQDPETGNWVPIGRTHSPEMEVTGLTPGKAYNFRVKALNPEGESDPLETYTPVVAKDPFKEAGAPGRPEVTDWGKDHADLKWAPPENDGGAPITGYVVEKKEKGGPWEKVSEVPGDKLKATVPLDEGKEYEFRVVPVNKAGLGEPSDPSQSIIAKPRFLRPCIDRNMFNDLTIRVGQPIKFDVNVEGEPPPTITWLVNDKDLRSETRTTLENSEYNTKLTIRKVTRADCGKYTINAVNESGKDTASVNVLVIDAPKAPEGPLEVSDVHKEGCKLKWKKPKDDGGLPLQGYEVEKMDPETGTWLPVGKTKEPCMEVTGLTPGKDYKFRVRAVNKEGESDPLETTKPITAKNPFDEPGKTGKPEVTDWDKDHVDLKWTPPESDGGSPVTGYIVEKKDKWGDWEKAVEVPADQTSATVPNLIQGQPYEFRVRAVNKAGPGEPSAPTDPVVAKSRKVPPKIDRTNLHKVRVKTGQSFNFDVNVTGEPAPTTSWLLNGKKFLSTDHVRIEEVPYNTKFLVRHAKRSDSGKYTITAVNDYGKDEAEVEVVVLAHPSQPNGPLKIDDVHAEGCTLKWFPPSDDGGAPIDHYEVEKMDPQTGQWVPAGETIGPDTNLKIKGLQPGKPYKFRVKAVNRLGESEPLEAAKPIIAKNPYDPPSAPGQPEIVDYDKDFVTMKWKKPTNDGGAPLTGYIIEKKDKYNPDWVPIQEVPGDEERCTIPDLVEGNQYEFRVRAVNKAGPSDPSEPTSPHIAKPKKLPPKIDKNAMFNIRVKVGKSFELDVPVSGEPPPTKKWNLGTKACESMPRWTVVHEDYNTKLSVRNAERGDSGQLTLTARNMHGNDSATITVTVLAPPTAPEGMQITNVTKEGCALAWRPPKDDGGSEITHYVVEKKDAESGKWLPVGESINPHMRADKLIEGHEYNFRVKAVNKEGESPWLLGREAIVAKNPFDSPDKPTSPQVVDWDNDHVDLAWTPPRRDGGAPITGYIVEKKPKNSPVWEEATRVEGNEPRAIVPNLKEGEEYEFRVSAVNKAGPGEPSEPCSPFLVKPKFLAPSIDKAMLHDIKVRVGRPINYLVPIKGEPTPTVTWTINNKPAVSKRMEISSSNSQASLDIQNSERSDSGKYTLTLQNTSGVVSASANVIVMDRPSPPEGPLNVSDVCKDSATLSWKASKDDGGVPIKHYLVEKMDTTRGTWSEVGTTSDLKFKVPKLIYKKRYQFRVKAVNEVGESDPLETKDSILAKDAYEPPSSPTKPEVVDYDKDKVDLAWTAPKDTGGAPLTGYIVQKKERGSPIWTKAADVPANQTKCTVPGLTEGNDYEFRVIAVNKAGESEPSDPSDLVTAKPKFLPPKIITPLREMKVRGGLTLTADIKFVGEPVPEVTWMLHDKPVVSGDRVTISNFEDHTILNIIDVRRSDSGPYTLMLKNPHGKDSGILDVNILDKPGPPQGPLNVDEVDKDRVKLSWRPPKDDGGSPLTGYVVEKRDKTRGGNWLPAVAYVSPTSKECAVPKLTEGTEYEFRIMAQNANGTSEPLTTDRPVLAKSPYGVPGKPSQPEPVDYDRDFIKIKWEPPRSNGGSPIIGYDIERKDKKLNRWVKINKHPVPSCTYTDDTVTDGHQYEYRVSARNAAGNGAPSEASKPIMAKPMKEKPKLHLDGLYGKIIRVKAGDPLKINIPLTGSPTPTTSWSINDKPMPITNRIQTDSTEDSVALSIPKAQRGDSGKYTITAKNDYGEDSADMTVIVYDKPGCPKNLEYPEVTANQITLKWKKPDDDGGSEITGYQVEKCEVGVERWTPVTSFCPTPTCIAKNLEEGKQYRFRVRAENMYGVSDPLEGKPVYAKNPFDTPDAPGQPKVKEFGPNFANITWTPPVNDGGKPITGYIIEKRERGVPDWYKVNSFPTPHTEFNIPNLTEGKTYEFRVMAVNEGGSGKPSKPSAPITAKEQKFAPSAPDMPRVDKVTKNSVTLSWNRPLHDGGSKITGYLIEKKPKGAKQWDIINTFPHPDTTFTVPNLKEGEEYEFRIIAVNDIGDSPPSRPCSLVKVEDQPDKPRIDAGALKDITVKAGEEFSLTAPFTGFPKPNAIWSKNEVDLDEKDPRCFFKVGDDYAVLGVSNAKRADSGQYKLFLKNISGFDTCYCKVTVLDKPGPPENLHAEDMEGDSLTLKWQPPKDDGGSEVTNYIVEKQEKGTTVWSRVSSFVNGTSTRVRNLTVGRQYQFRVMAENLYGVSDPATMDPVYAKLPYDPPGAPGIPHSIETSTDSITLTWTKPRNDGGSPITGYVLEKRKFGDNKWVRATNVTIPNLTHRVGGLQENNEYEFRVAACNAAGQGPWSSNSDGIIARMPPCPPKLDTSFAMRDLTVPAGEPFTLRVPYIGSPPPTALWTLVGCSLLSLLISAFY